MSKNAAKIEKLKNRLNLYGDAVDTDTNIVRMENTIQILRQLQDDDQVGILLDVEKAREKIPVRCGDLIGFLNACAEKLQAEFDKIYDDATKPFAKEKP